MTERTPNRRLVFYTVVLLTAALLAPLMAAGQANDLLAAKKAPAPDPPDRTVERPASAANLPPEYRIGEQDVLDISVWHEKDLSTTVVVRPDGQITVPLINEMYVIGMTPRQLQALITEKLGPLVNLPQVTVSVRQINSRQVYVIGEVARKGVFHINSTTTVLQLLAEIGGPLDYAKRKRIYVLRNESGKQERIPFNYDEVIKGKRTSQNIVLRPGDTVVVP